MNTINYFNPLASKFHAVHDFRRRLTTSERIVTCVVTILASLASCFILGLGA